MFCAFPEPSNEVERQSALCSFGILDTEPDPAFDRLTKLAATIFGVPIALVSLIDNSRQWFKSRYGTDVAETPRDMAFCAYAILSDEVMVVPDATEDPRFCSNPLVTGPMGLRFYAGAPIKTRDGYNLGTLCIKDTVPRSVFTPQEKETLKTLAAMAFEALESHGRTLALLRKEAEARDRYSLVARATLDGVWDWNIRTRDVFYSPRWQYILGLPEKNHHATTAHWLDRVHPEDRSAVDADLEKHLARETSRFRSEHRMRHQDGSWRWVVVRGLAQHSSTGAAVRMAGSLMDITADKTSDPLTGLPNRILLQERLAQLIRRSEATQKWHFAVLFLDVDRFKSINDRFGHLVGDTVLKVIAQRLQSEVLKTRSSAESMVARFAGDEFVIVLDGVENGDQAVGIADRLHDALSLPVDWEGDRLTAGASIGIAMATPGFKNPGAFLHSSDLAMYRAKAAGRGASVLFDPIMQEQTVERLKLESGLRQAVDAGQMRVLYQPQIDLRTGRLVGCEALIRWQHPRRGLLAPVHFIELAEEIGVIASLDLWVMETACKQLAAWRKLPGGAALTMSVNISGKHLSERGLEQAVRQTLAKCNLPPAALCLELTESILIEDFIGGNRLMHELRSVGVGLHMDDFGSGYSSFKQLYEMPFDTLKIDRSLLSNIEVDHQSANIVEGILRLAHTMQLKVVAEGIENLPQAEMLEKMGCDQGQGYHYDRPIDPVTFQRRHIMPAPPRRRTGPRSLAAPASKRELHLIVPPLVEHRASSL